MATHSKDALVLNVMRLNTPKYQTNFNQYTHIGHLFNPDEQTLVDPTHKTLTHSHSLIIPDEHGEVFVGEQFHAFISALNTSDFDLQDVKLQVEMIRNHKTYTLFDNSNEQITQLRAHQSFDFTISHEIDYSGSYVMTCFTSHTHPVTSDRFHRKHSFAFTAQNLFEVSFHISNYEEQQWISCQINNSSNECVFLIKAELVSPFGQPLERLASQNSTDETHTGVHFFKPQDIYEVLFISDTSSNLIQNDTQKIGDLFLSWRSLKTTWGYLAFPISQNYKPPENFNVNIKSSPNPAEIGKPFSITLEINNTTSSKIELIFEFDWDEMEPLIHQGSKTEKIGSVNGNSTTFYEINLMCVQQGFHPLKGITIKDVKTDKIIWDKPLGDIFVF